MLTDSGFLKAKAAIPPQPQQPNPQQTSEQPKQNVTEGPIDIHELSHKKSGNTTIYLLALLLVIVVAAGVYYLYYIR